MNKIDPKQYNTKEKSYSTKKCEKKLRRIDRACLDIVVRKFNKQKPVSKNSQFLNSRFKKDWQSQYKNFILTESRIIHSLKNNSKLIKKKQRKLEK